MIRIIFKETSVDLTDEYKSTIEGKFKSLEKYSRGSDMTINLEIGRTTNHHRNGDIYKTEVRLNLDGSSFYVMSEASDLPASIDESLNKMANELKNEKDKGETMFRRGARSVKKMMKGLTTRNPFTSKYEE